MDSVLFCGLVAVVVFAGGALGLQLQRTLPEGFTTGGPRDMIGAVVGLVTLLLALALGLLIWTAFGVYSAQKASMQTLAINALKLDSALSDFGPEAEEGRKVLKTSLERTIAQIWGGGYDSDFVIKNYQYALADLKEREAFLDLLQPSSDKQRAAQAGAMQAAVAISQTRTQLALSLVDPVSYPLMSMVLAWATCLFCGFGLLSKRHVMSYLALAVGALAVASASYAIADLSDPYSGLFQVSPAPIVDVMKAVDATTNLLGHR
jgi:hypothetical protein